LGSWDLLEFDVVVIGGGIVGLATAAAASKKFDSVLLLEKNRSIVMETSARNSEVIHAGLYYAAMPIKNELCIDGRGLLEDYCSSNNVNFSKVGKYVFSVNSPDKLDNLFDSAIDSGATGLKKCGVGDINYLNKWCDAKYAFFSANTGILDSHGLAFSLLRDFEDNGGICSLASSVTGIEFGSKYYVTFVDGNGDIQIASSERLVNCAGLSSLEVLDYLYKDHEMENYFIKGHYFSGRLSSPVPHLLYPMPEALGLGVHLTLDLNGQVKFGPDTQHVYDVNYRQGIDTDAFYKKVASNFKIAGPESLRFDYAGIRPKIKLRGEVASDFIFLTEKDHHLNGMVSLHGIDSPGLTSCLSIAEKVMSIL
jgi:L-2-hydroxyglutarate oxidase LhgO